MTKQRQLADDKEMKAADANSSELSEFVEQRGREVREAAPAMAAERSTASSISQQRLDRAMSRMSIPRPSISAIVAPKLGGRRRSSSSSLRNNDGSEATYDLSNIEGLEQIEGLEAIRVLEGGGTFRRSRR